ncbi:hypothetical protein FBY35_4725 [Streptomyces sp. SLBN-118]|nr:hypothetical protein FBY35_4725 [Streptomyces sp. SLBN-118]
MADQRTHAFRAPSAGAPGIRSYGQRMPKPARARLCAAVGRAGQYR